MEIPGLGTVTKDREYGLYYSDPMPVSVLGGQMCHIIVERYDEDPNKAEFHAAIANFLSIPRSVLEEAAPYVFQYYQDCNNNYDPDDDEFINIESPQAIWAHIRIGNEPVVTRRAYGDQGIYVSLDCGCDWEEEHGLQIVFKHGLKINKVGSYDGHLTNSDAYADDSLEDIIYR